MDIESVITDWKHTTDELIHAVHDRDMRKFRHCCSRGGNHFTQVRQYLDSHEICDQEIKEQLTQTIVLWLGTVDGIQEWQSEIGDEMEAVRNRRKNHGKIKNTYSTHVKTTGLNIDRKAR